MPPNLGEKPLNSIVQIPNPALFEVKAQGGMEAGSEDRTAKSKVSPGNMKMTTDRRRYQVRWARPPGSRRRRRTPSQNVPRESLLAALRCSLDALPLTDRQLVALRFGGGLSTEEIARGMSLTRAAITRRIKSTLMRLRADLRRAGFPSAICAVTPKTLNEAISESAPVPPGLYERVLHQVEHQHTKPRSTRISRKSTRQTSQEATMWLYLSAVTAATLGAMFWAWCSFGY